ncbi:AAA family ATPase [Paenibacillus gansuensis]|uniref:CpaE family protein n=1 Tax=Paenibacillus gansuensis TaxID=306542 RepID=A0ABW5PES5_9BACL
MNIIIAVTEPELGERIASRMEGRKHVHVCCTDEELVKLAEAGTGNTTHMFLMEELFEKEYPWDWMPRLRGYCPNAIIVLGRSGQEDPIFREVITSLALEFNVSTIPPYGIWDDVIRETEAYFFGTESIIREKGGTIITFASAAPKDGATTAAISAAAALAQGTSASVGLLDLNFKSPEIQDQLRIKGAKGFPFIQAECDSKTLNPDILRNACSALPGIPTLHILTGLRRREWAERITPEEISHLLEVARQTFDVTLVDVHTFPDQAATVQSVRSADLRCVIVQPLVTSYESSWHDWYRGVWTYFGLTEKDFHMVLNRASKGGHTEQDIRRSTGAELLGTLPELGIVEGNRAVNDGVPFALAQGGGVLGEYQQAIRGLSRKLAQHAGIAWTETEEPRERRKHRTISMMLPFMKNLQ